jgi:DNA polymerase
MDPKKFKQELLDALYEPYKKCLECPLGYAGRTKVVFGEGNPDADLLFLGEAPGKDEDLQGRPFVGVSGQLLTRALTLVGIDRSQVFITNVVKCRPPGNRVPLPLESNTCMSLFFYKQIQIIRPRIICTLGSVALNALMQQPYAITKVRGNLMQKEGLHVFPTYHPAYILRNKTQAQIWLDDFKLLKELLEKTSRM